MRENLLSLLAMVGLILLCFISLAGSQEDDLAQLSSQLLSLQESVEQKESCILEQDKVISDLQRHLQGVKAAKLDAMVKKNEEELFSLQCKVQSLLSDIDRLGSESQQAAELDAMVKKNEEELLSLQCKIQGLLSDIDRLGSESQQLEMISASQMKQLNEAQLALHLVKESITETQAQVDERDRDIHKVYTQWLPYWVKKDLAHWQVTWISTFRNAWKRAVAVCGFKKLHESKFLRQLDVLEVQIWTYKKRVQKIVEEEVHDAWEICKNFLSGPVKILELHLSQSNSIFQPYLSKLNLYVNMGLKYGINHHLQLQCKIRKLLQRNKYLASKESREVVWFLASALLILPLYGALILSSFLGERRRSSGARTTRYRRRHAAHWRHAQRQPLMVLQIT